ncbi:ergothioneine biosynthesis glutamate--cysteine ligase EgtA, partial [Streptomyces sp. SID7760]|nr:ergothioneine biosynthesis glutamate--cysteine ligase EgtA [Streptomyces sp. SID7760]
RAAAAVCFRAAVQALPRLGASRHVQDVVGAFTERFPLRGRCPADDGYLQLTGTGARS